MRQKNKKICPDCLRVVGDKTRSKIIQKLKEKQPMSVSGILSCFCKTQPTISYHLKALKRLGIIYGNKKGREVFYSLNKKYPCKKCFILKTPFRL